MTAFDYSFTVRAPLPVVAEFHRDPHALRRLTPPPVMVMIHRAEPLAEGSIADFTLWFGPLPIRWVARHTRIDALHGFTDTQIHGPMKRWVHTHRFTEESDGITRIAEHIDYVHRSGLRGWLTRLLFAAPGLHLTFRYRRWMTRRLLEGRSPTLPEGAQSTRAD